MTPATAIDMLNRMLATDGEDVSIVRSGVPKFRVKAAVRGLKAEELRTANGVQVNFRGVLSPTDFPAGFLPLRTSDKIVRNGEQRTVGWVDHKALGSTLVRITADFAG